MMKKQIKFNKYQAGGKVSPANTQKAVSAYTDEANRLKGLYAKQPNNDTWLDIPQKTAMYLTGLGYQKPSDFLYAHGLRNVPYHQEAALIADLVADPLNLIPAAGFARNLKRGKIGAGSLPKLGSYVWDAAAGKEVIDYVKSRSSDINNWLGENTGYKFGFGGDLGRFALDNLEQSTLGTLGLDFYKPKYDSDTMAKIGQVSQGIGQGVNKAMAGIASAMNPMAGAVVNGIRGIGANTQFHRNGMNVYQGGQEVNQVQMQDMIPHNLNYLDKVSENLIQMNGPSHQQGGIKTNAGEFDKSESILKKGVVGNPTPFAFSDNLKISKEVQKQLGLPTNMRNKTIADASKFIENKYETKYNDMPIQRNTKDRMKQSLYTKLMNANKIEFAKNRIENGIQSKEDMSFDELNSQYQGGMEVDLFPKKQTYEWNTNNVPQEIPSQYMRNYEVRSKVPNIQAINGTNKTTNWTNYLDYSKNSPQNFMTEMENGELSTDFKIPFTGQKGSLYNISDYMPKEDIINSDMENRARNIKVNTLDIPDITAKMDENDKGIKDKQSNFWNSMSDLEKIGLGANALSTLGQGLTMLKKDKIPTFYNENSSQINNIMSDRRIDMQPMINDLNSQYNAATSKDNSRSWNVQRGLNTNMYNQYAKSLGELGMKGQEMNNQYKSQYAETLNNLGMQNVQARTTQEELQARTDDIRMNNIRQLMANTGNNLSKFAFTKNLADKTINEGKHLLDTMTTDFGINASTAQDFVNKMDDPNWKPIMAIMTKPDYQGNAMQDAFAAIEKLNASRAEKDMYKLDVIAFENSKTKKTTTKTVSGNTTTTETK